MSRGSLARANRGTRLILAGQSNANQCGNNTGPAPLSKPAAGVLYVDGALQASYSAVNHGVEVGLLDELINVGGRAGATLFRRGVNGTTAGVWNTTHAAALVADVTTAALGPPACGVWIQGEAEAAVSEAAANAWDADMLSVLAKFKSAWGGAFGLVVIRIRTTDAVNYPWHANVRARQDVIGADWPGVALVNVDDMPLATDVSGTVHYTSATAIEAGRRAARALMTGGIL